MQSAADDFPVLFSVDCFPLSAAVADWLCRHPSVGFLVVLEVVFDTLVEFLGYLKCDGSGCHIGCSFLVFRKVFRDHHLDELAGGDALFFQFLPNLCVQIIRKCYR